MHLNGYILDEACSVIAALRKIFFGFLYFISYNIVFIYVNYPLRLEYEIVQVGFGRTICTPLRPRCGECGVSRFCPSAFKETSSSSSRSNKSRLNMEPGSS
jgi:hypothetical protein